MNGPGPGAVAPVIPSCLICGDLAKSRRVRAIKKAKFFRRDNPFANSLKKISAVVGFRDYSLGRLIARHDHSLVAISLGATCFGALTYIGNGPNLLVKAVVEHAGIKTPGFFGYIFKFALPILIPIFIAVTLLFFR